MSYGIRINNTNNNLVIDENHPVFFAPDIQVTQSGVQLDDTVSGAYTYRTYFISVFMQPTFSMVSQDPPMVFWRPSEKGVTEPFQPWYQPPGYKVQPGELGLETWASTFGVSFFGEPGEWIGVNVTFKLMARHTDSTKLPLATFIPGGITIPGYTMMTDFTKEFCIVGTGDTRKYDDDYGLIIWDENENVVFNSNSNHITMTDLSGDWTYVDRELLADGHYLENWVSNISPVEADEWVSIVPRCNYLRANGENSGVGGFASKIGEPVKKVIVTGRSGSTVHNPIIKLKTMRPIVFN